MRSQNQKKHVSNGIASEDLYQSMSEKLSMSLDEHTYKFFREITVNLLRWIELTVSLSLSLSDSFSNLRPKKRNFYRNIERWPSNVTKFPGNPKWWGFGFYFKKI